MNNYYENQVELSGLVNTNFEYLYEEFGKKLYGFELAVQRMSGTIDYIPILVAEEEFVDDHLVDSYVHIIGTLRYYGKKQIPDKRLLVYVEFMEVEKYRRPKDINRIVISGILESAPVFRITKSERKITDLSILVKRRYWTFDYIPTIVWGRNAEFAKNFGIGDHIKLIGTIQSRQINNKSIINVSGASIMK